MQNDIGLENIVLLVGSCSGNKANGSHGPHICPCIFKSEDWNLTIPHATCEGAAGQMQRRASSLEHAAVTVHQQETSGFPGAFSYHLKGGFTLTAIQLPQLFSPEKIIFQFCCQISTWCQALRFVSETEPVKVKDLVPLPCCLLLSPCNNVFLFLAPVKVQVKKHPVLANT